MKYGKEMTNSELLEYSGPCDLLNGIERQRHFILHIENEPKPCPNCGTPLRRWEALGLAVDDYDLVKGGHSDAGECPNCHRGLRFTLPFPAGGWHWSLVPAEG